MSVLGRVLVVLALGSLFLTMSLCALDATLASAFGILSTACLGALVTLFVMGGSR
jgi:hypothetical protein